MSDATIQIQTADFERLQIMSVNALFNGGTINCYYDALRFEKWDADTHQFVFTDLKDGNAEIRLRPTQIDGYSRAHV